MRRLRRPPGTVEIVHSSFIDLLFGAFGAFVFLMIVYVLQTINLTPEKLVEAIDQAVEENRVLHQQLKDYDRLKQDHAELTRRLQQKTRENAELRKAYQDAREEKERLQQQVDSMARELHEAQARIKEIAAAEEKVNAILKENHRLRDDLDGVRKALREVQKMAASTRILEGDLERTKSELAEAKGQVVRLEERLKEVAPPSEETPSTTEAVMQWLKYLSWLILYVIAVELCNTLSNRQLAARDRILKENDARLVIEPDGTAHIDGVRSGAISTVAEQINSSDARYSFQRTMVWGVVFVLAVLFSIMAMHLPISKVWVLIGGELLLYFFYLRKRYRLR